jgi:hypothetical protein
MLAGVVVQDVAYMLKLNKKIMAKYLGEVEVGMEDPGNPYTGFGIKDWMFEFIERYGSIDGAHHKDWVMNQCTKIYHGTPVMIRLASWDNGETEYRINLGEDSEAYKKYVEETEEAGYCVDEGIAP